MHGKDRIVVHKHAAAVWRSVTLDGAAVHGEGASLHVHACAPTAAIVAADGAAVHDELAVQSYEYTAISLRAVTDDNAAIDKNAARLVLRTQFPRIIFACVLHKIVLTADAVAVGQREGGIISDTDPYSGPRIIVSRSTFGQYDAMPVEVQHGAVIDLPCLVERHIRGQIPVTGGFRQAVIRGPRGKGGLLCAGMADSGTDVAAAEVVRMAFLLHCGVCLLRPNRRGQQGQAERQGGEDAEKFSLHRVPSRKKVGWFLLQRNQGDIPFKKLCLKSDCECTYKISQTGPNGKKNFVTLLLFGKGRPALWAAGDGAWGVSVY